MPKNEVVVLDNNVPLVPPVRKGVFEEGYDKKGRPYEKKMDTEGVYTKKEILLDGTQKLTIKKKI